MQVMLYFRWRAFIIGPQPTSSIIRFPLSLRMWMFSRLFAVRAVMRAFILARHTYDSEELSTPPVALASTLSMSSCEGCRNIPGCLRRHIYYSTYNATNTARPIVLSILGHL